MNDLDPNIDLNQLKTDLLSRFECQKSGNCCRREGYVYVTVQNMGKMASFLGVSLSEFQKNYVVKDGSWSLIASPTHRPTCFLTEENTCAIYPTRPQACKTYPHWDSLWKTKESVMAELAMCPGLKKAFNDLGFC